MAGLASCFANRESELIRANPQQQSTYWILLLELAAELSPFMARTRPSIRFCSVNSRKPTWKSPSFLQVKSSVLIIVYPESINQIHASDIFDEFKAVSIVAWIF